MEVQETCSFLFPNRNTCQEPCDVQSTESYLSLTISPLGSLTDLFCSFRSIYGHKKRGFIHLFYNYKNYSVSSPSHPRAMRVPSNFFNHGHAIWRVCIDMRIPGQLYTFLFNIQEVLIHWEMASNSCSGFCLYPYIGSKCLVHRDALRGIVLVLPFHLLWICAFISHVSSVGLALWFEALSVNCLPFHSL